MRKSKRTQPHLINEDDGWSMLPGQRKQLADQLLALAEPLADQVLAGDGKEGGLRLRGYRLRVRARKREVIPMHSHMSIWLCVQIEYGQCRLHLQGHCRNALARAC